MKIQTRIIIVLIFFILIGTIVYKFKNPTIITKTEVRIDTSYIQLPSEIIIKENPVTKYIQDPRILDSLYQYKKFYIDLQESLSIGKSLVVTDTTKFVSGDSLITEYTYFPINKFRHIFFPRPDRTIEITTTTEKTIDKTPLLTFYLGGGLSANFQDYQTTGKIFGIVPEISIQLSYKKSKISPYARYQFDHVWAGGGLYKFNLF